MLKFVLLKIRSKIWMMLALLGIMAVFGSHRELLAVCILLIPLHESVDFYYSLVICLAVAAGKHYRKIRINRAVLLVLGLVVWELLLASLELAFPH